jgi:hypothetical protein
LTRTAGFSAEAVSSPASCEGYAYDEISREEQITPERVHEIVREALGRRMVEDGTDHAKLQLARLAQAMQIAGAAVVNGEDDPGAPQSTAASCPPRSSL